MDDLSLLNQIDRLVAEIRRGKANIMTASVDLHDVWGDCFTLDECTEMLNHALGNGRGRH